MTQIESRVPAARQRMPRAAVEPTRAQRRQRAGWPRWASRFLLAVTSLSAAGGPLHLLSSSRGMRCRSSACEGFAEFFTSTRWYPSAAAAGVRGAGDLRRQRPGHAGRGRVAVPLGVAAAVCLSDVLPFAVRQLVKPVIEMLAAIPSVAYGFFALVVLAPLLQAQRRADRWRSALWLVGVPAGGVAGVRRWATWLTDRVPDRVARRGRARWSMASWARRRFCGCSLWAGALSGAEDCQRHQRAERVDHPGHHGAADGRQRLGGRAAGRRAASCARAATRWAPRGPRRMLRDRHPGGRQRHLAAVILGVMRAIGETMVVWMASGNAAQIPAPWYNLLQPVRTLTATIAGDMGEADQVTGSARYHVLFAMALCLLAFSFVVQPAQRVGRPPGAGEGGGLRPCDLETRRILDRSFAGSGCLPSP